MSRRARRLWFVVLAIVALMVLGATALTAATFQVAAVNFEFEPSSRTILVGDTVVWTMSGDPHTVRSGTVDANGLGHPSDGPLNSGIQLPGQTYSHEFTATGTYPYFCEIHADSQMKGTITVIAAAATPKPTAKPTPRITPRPSPRPTPRPTVAPTPARGATPVASVAVIASPTDTPTTPSPAVPAVSRQPTGSPMSSPRATPTSTGNGAGPVTDTTPLAVAGILVVIAILGAVSWRTRRNP